MELVSDCAYRRLCFEQGAGWTFTEMVRPNSVAKRNRASMSRIDTFDPATPTSVQFLGTGPKGMREGLRALEEGAQGKHPHWAEGIHGVDVNMGCPSANIVRDGQGPALLTRTAAVEKMFEVMAQWRARTRLPVGMIGAKIRLGVDAEEERREVFLSAIEAARGRLDYVVVHGRHARDDSKLSRARWHQIARAKEVAGDALKIIGNGDVYTREDAAAMIRETGCDGVMSARGSIRTAGVIFDPGWQGEDEYVVARADRLEQRYLELAAHFGGPRPQIGEYHAESFRRIRARAN